MNSEEVSGIIDDLMKPHCSLLDIDVKKTKDRDNSYTLEALNLRGDITPGRILAAAEKYRNTADQDYPMNILLSGPPGTGKTAFTEFLGLKMDCPVITRMGSDLLSMFVGGTEQNITSTFREAENENAILFLDEADGLFRTREQANRSWEITQVNQLLHEMEKFSGILVCATNFSSNLDRAAMRRFTFKLEFDYLNDDGKILLLNRYFPALQARPFRGLREIASLTPGDFRTVYQKYRYLGVDSPSEDEIIEALAEESRARFQGKDERVIGFVRDGSGG
ncbi:MAG: AAA family ATPase [Spirochaetales bacterium]|nr:AAA family ATPase [Spirochaetales bacterium]